MKIKVALRIFLLHCGIVDSLSHGWVAHEILETAQSRKSHSLFYLTLGLDLGLGLRLRLGTWTRACQQDLTSNMSSWQVGPSKYLTYRFVTWWAL